MAVLKNSINSYTKSYFICGDQGGSDFWLGSTSPLVPPGYAPAHFINGMSSLIFVFTSKICQYFEYCHWWCCRWGQRLPPSPFPAPYNNVKCVKITPISTIAVCLLLFFFFFCPLRSRPLCSPQKLLILLPLFRVSI